MNFRILTLIALAAGSASANLGDKIALKQAPWNVSLRSEDFLHGCGAALIAPRWLITAGDCVEWLDTDEPIAKQMSAWGGASRLKKLRPLPPIKAIHLAPGFEFVNHKSKFFKLTVTESYTAKNNVALIELESPAEISVWPPRAGLSANELRKYEESLLLPISLRDTELSEGDPLFFSGWGKGPRGARKLRHGPSKDLRGFTGKYRTNETAVKIMTATKKFARSHLRKYVAATEMMTTLETKSTCSGDSGSGVAKIESDGTYTLVGVNSHGDGDCRDVNPLRSSTSTRVAPFSEWIAEKIRE